MCTSVCVGMWVKPKKQERRPRHGKGSWGWEKRLWSMKEVKTQGENGVGGL